MILYFIIAACLINLENFECVETTLKMGLNRQKRSVLKDESSKWPGGIVPYMFHENFNDENGKLVAEEAMMRIQNQTCIRFIQRTNETDYLLIKRDYEIQPCLSPVGYYKNGPQSMTFGNSCAQRSVMIHELLHVLGFLHEHQRVDRDNYIVVNASNVQYGFESEFKLEDPYNSTTQDIPYDINSIMHYKNFAFSKYINQTTNSVSYRKDYMTMYSKSDYKIALGNSTDLTPSDIKRVALRYNCSLPIEPSTTTSAQPATTTAAQPSTTALIKTSVADVATTPSNITTTTMTTKSGLTNIYNQSALLQPCIISTFFIILLCTFLL